MPTMDIVIGPSTNALSQLSVFKCNKARDMYTRKATTPKEAKDHCKYHQRRMCVRHHPKSQCAYSCYRRIENRCVDRSNVISQHSSSYMCLDISQRHNNGCNVDTYPQHICPINREIDPTDTSEDACQLESPRYVA